MKRICIFDLDGTLVDSLADLADAVNAGLRAMGLPEHPTDAYAAMVGNGTKKLCERALPVDCTERIDELHTLFSVEYALHSLDKTRPYDGIPALLQALRAQGCLLAVASNKPQAFAETIVRECFGTELFAAVRGSACKPAPDAISALLDTLGADRDEAVLLGDSDVDLFTAKNAGIASLACGWGYRSVESLLAAGAPFVANNPAQAENLLKAL